MKFLLFLRAYIQAKFCFFLSKNFYRLFKKIQEKKLSSHLKYIVKNSEYYKEILDGKEIKLENFPIIDKELMLKEFDKMNTRKLSLEKMTQKALKAEETRMFSNKEGDITYGLSSGTSGNRGIFLLDEKESIKWLGAVFAKLGHLRKNFFKPKRIAFFMRANSNLYQSVGGFYFKFKFFDIFNNFDDNVKKLNDFKPTIIIGQPSILKLLAEDSIKNDKKYPLIETMTIAETLEKNVEDFITNTFKVPNYNVYQATEGFIACTYGDHLIHINEDLVYIEKEYIDKEKTRFIPIITDLNRKVQPFIRYRLNDILVENKQNLKGFMVIDGVEGRSDEYFEFLNRKGEKIMIFPDFIRNAVIKVAIDLKDYWVIQEESKKINIILDTNVIVNIDLVKESFEKLFIYYGIEGVEISILLEKIVREKGKKLIRIKRKFNF